MATSEHLSSTRRVAARARAPDECGAGIVSMAFGVFFMLTLLFFGVHLAFGLYARSMISSQMYEAARDAVRYGGAEPNCAEMIAAARTDVIDSLGEMGRSAEITGTCTPDVLSMSIVVSPPGFLPPIARDADPLGSFSRTVQVRIERLQESP